MSLGLLNSKTSYQKPSHHGTMSKKKKEWRAEKGKGLLHSGRVSFKDRIHNGSVSLGFDIHRAEPGVTARTWREKCLLIDALPLESTAWTDAHFRCRWSISTRCCDQGPDVSSVKICLNALIMNELEHAGVKLVQSVKTRMIT